MTLRIFEDFVIIRNTPAFFHYVFGYIHLLHDNFRFPSWSFI